MGYSIRMAFNALRRSGAHLRLPVAAAAFVCAGTACPAYAHLKELAARIDARVRGWRDKEIDRELRREAQEERIDKADKRAGLRNLACGARVPAAHRSLPATCVHIRRAAT